MAMFEGGPDAGSMDLGFGPDPQPERQDNQEPATGTGQIVMTSEQFQQLLATLGQRAQERDYAAAIGGQEPEPLPEIDLSQLPDPRTDFEAFKSALGQGLTQAREQIAVQTRQEIDVAAQRERTINDAWSMFRERHPDVAAHEDIVGMAYQREVAELQLRGIDPIAVLTQNMEAAVDRLAERAGATINRIKGLQEGDGSGDADRTDMISGGSPRPASRRSGAEKPSNFTDEIKRVQREMGIY